MLKFCGSLICVFNVNGLFPASLFRKSPFLTHHLTQKKEWEIYVLTCHSCILYYTYTFAKYIAIASKCALREIVKIMSANNEIAIYNYEYVEWNENCCVISSGFVINCENKLSYFTASFKYM